MNNYNLMNMIRGANPQQIIMQILQQNSQNNPILNNVLNLANNQDGKGIENVARNLCKAKGIDADRLYNQISQRFQ